MGACGLVHKTYQPDDVVVFGTYTGNLRALQIGASSGAWSVKEKWKSPMNSFVGSPVLSGDRLYGIAFNRRGLYFSLEVESGEPVWTSEGREGPTASLLDVGSVLLILDAFGELLIVEKTDRAFSPVAHYAVGASQTWVHPAIVAGDLLIRDTETLRRWSFAANPPGLQTDLGGLIGAENSN